MFISLTLFFSLLNFGVLIGLGVYVYRTYGKHMLFEHMRSQEEALRLLQLEEVALQEEKERLSQLIQKEQRTTLQLMEKVALWRAVQDKERHAAHEAQQEITQSLKKKVQAQADWYAQHQLVQGLLPHVVAKAQEQLVKEFQESIKQKRYNQDVITFMKKRVS